MREFQNDKFFPTMGLDPTTPAYKSGARSAGDLTMICILKLDLFWLKQLTNTLLKDKNLV